MVALALVASIFKVPALTVRVLVEKPPLKVNGASSCLGQITGSTDGASMAGIIRSFKHKIGIVDDIAGQTATDATIAEL